MDGLEAPPAFNLSHSGDHGLVALGGHGRLGIDVEVRLPRRHLSAIARRVLGPVEQAALERTEGEAERRLFHRFWTLKEALIKASGEGFALDPAGFEVPPAMIGGGRRGHFRFPGRSGEHWCLDDLGEERFAAALAREIGEGAAC